MLSSRDVHSPTFPAEIGTSATADQRPRHGRLGLLARLPSHLLVDRVLGAAIDTDFLAGFYRTSRDAAKLTTYVATQICDTFAGEMKQRRRRSFAHSMQRLEYSCLQVEAAQRFVRQVEKNNTLRLGCWLAERGQLDEANFYYRLVLQAEPSHSYAYVLLGAAFVRQEKYADARAAYTARLRWAPNCFSSRANLAILANDQADRSLSTLHDMLADHPTSGACKYAVGCALLNLKQNEQAEGVLRDSLALATGADRAKIMVKLSIALTGQQNREREALALCQQAVELDPTDAEAYLGIASLLLSQGECEGARSNVQRALAINDCLEDAHSLLALIYCSSGSPQLAEMHLETRTRLGSTSALQYSMLAGLQMKHCPATASKTMQRAIELDPSDAAQHVVLARIHDRLGNRAAAISAMTAAARLQPSNQAAQAQLAVWLAD